MNEFRDRDGSGSFGALPTTYNGNTYFSRLEAKWACFFEHAKINNTYEAQGYSVEDGTKYNPDFYFPDYDIYGEVKGNIKYWQKDIERVSKFLTSKTPFKGIMIFGDIPRYFTDKGSVYWFPFLYYDPLTDGPEMTYVPIVDTADGGIIKTDLTVSSMLRKPFHVDMQTPYDLISPVFDENVPALLKQNRFPIMLSDFPTPHILKGLSEARSRNFQEGGNQYGSTSHD